MPKVGLVRLLPCVFLDDVFCEFRESTTFVVMDRCLSCSHYLRFADELERGEDEFFAEVDRRELESVKCLFDGGLCDIKPKVACFQTDLQGGNLWKCSRFNVDMLSSDSIMRKTYLRLARGRGWK